METQTPLICCFPVFFALFSVVYIIGYFLVFRSWNRKQRLDASSCLISLAHGTPAVFLAIFALLSKPSSFASPNSNLQNLVLDFSIAYFAVDLLHLSIFFPGDFLFIAHHLATLFVFVTCRYLALHGAFSILVLLVLAEVTSAFQNIWTLAGLRREEFLMAETVYRTLSPPFFALYSIMRGLFGPLFFLKMSIFYLSGEADDVISRWIFVSWIAVVGGAILVSILWVSNLWMELFREMKKANYTKEK
ncbi:TLC domain-containing protein At5g14285 [Dendrobium catenatum]|uniref:TLC domain-containing protein n=1 Tax=Dendrobium catenatum TaxID=906689 RepID=A0A2I0WLE0_9ASPA|nr:TLC domain-containing protein At5g14285 [Dendrobium catenatum]PKU76471.1 hypothetical protein MA16_Dca001074 [Dendrobium catenatum]